MILIDAFDQIQTSYRNFPKLGIHLLKIKKKLQQAVHQSYQHPLRRNSITAKVRKMDDVGFKYGAPKPINNSKIAI